MTNEEFNRVEEMFREMWEAALEARNAAQRVLNLKQKFGMELAKARIEQMQAQVKS